MAELHEDRRALARARRRPSARAASPSPGCRRSVMPGDVRPSGEMHDEPWMIEPDAVPRRSRRSAARTRRRRRARRPRPRGPARGRAGCGSRRSRCARVCAAGPTGPTARRCSRLEAEGRGEPGAAHLPGGGHRDRIDDDHLLRSLVGRDRGTRATLCTASLSSVADDRRAHAAAPPLVVGAEHDRRRATPGWASRTPLDLERVHVHAAGDDRGRRGGRRGTGSRRRRAGRGRRR